MDSYNQVHIKVFVGFNRKGVEVRKHNLVLKCSKAPIDRAEIRYGSTTLCKMARTIPPSFVEIGPKLRVVAPLKWEWPKTAKNRGEPQKMTPSSETEIFLGVVPMGKL